MAATAGTSDGNDLSSWFEAVKGEVPLALTGPSMTLSPLPSPYPPTVFLYGGKVVQTRRMSDQMWALDLNRREWSRVNAGPGPGVRYFHSMDVWQDKLVLFGGMSEREQELNGPSYVHDDVWFFDCRTRRWLPQPSPQAGPSFEQDPAFAPSARYAHLSAVSRDKLIVLGGQRQDNSWIYEISAYDLKRNVWVSKTPQPESHGLHSKGAYRSVAISSNQRVVQPLTDSQTLAGAKALPPTLPWSEDEEGYGGNIYCYSNYDFAKVRREFEIIQPVDGDDEVEPVSSEKFTSIPGYTVRDLSTKMSGTSQPPGLRFPSGGVVGNHFVLTGLYLASTSGAFSIWALDLTTMIWTHIEPAVLKHGSWNRPVLCPDTARLLVFGCADSDLTTDYGKRAVNLNHVAVIELEAYGIYRPPKQEISSRDQDMGLTILDEKCLYDFEIVSQDNRRIRCSRRVLEKRWAWFAEQQASIDSRAHEVIHDITSLDMQDALAASLSPARVTPTRLHLPEDFAVCVALVQYFYMLDLSTPLLRRGPILTSLLCLATTYKIERLRKLVVHALHNRLDPENAIMLYQVAILVGETALASRSLNVLRAARADRARSSHGHNHSRGPGTTTTSPGSTGGPSAGGGTTPSASHMGLPNETTSGASTINANGGGGGGAGNTTRRRARSDSLTVPEDLLSRVESRGVLSDDMATTSSSSSQSSEDSMFVSLLNALDINAPAPPKRLSPRALRSSSRSSSPAPSVAGSTRSRRRRPAPPMLPPPVRPLPFAPHDSALSPPATPQTGPHRISSPTFSEATSSFPRTPSEATRDSLYLTREQSPVSPTADRRLSLGDSSLRSKGKTLPSLPEDGISTFEMSSEDDSRVSTETSEGEHETLQTPCIITLDPSSAPLHGNTLNVQQEAAMAKLTANSGTRLARATSLNSLTQSGMRPKSAMAEYTREASDGGGGDDTIRAGQLGGVMLMALAENGGGIESPSSADRSKTWAQRKDSLGLGVGSTEALGAGLSNSGSPYSKRHSLLPKPSHVPEPEISEHEREQLAKFHAFIAEQQRQAGRSEAEAIARKATGRAGMKRFGAWRAKLGDVLH